MDFLQRTPFFRLLFPFILGILAYPIMGLTHASLLVIFLLSIALLACPFLMKVPKQQYKFRWLFGSGIFLFMFSLAYFTVIERENSFLFDHLKQKGIFRVELTAAPIEKTKSFLCKVDLMQFYDQNRWNSTQGKAILYIQKNGEAAGLLTGDRILIETEFLPPEKVQNPDGFDYGAYLKRQGVGATAYVSATGWRWTDRNNSFSLQRSADKCRNYLLGIYREFNIAGDEFAVLAALTLGYTDALQPDLRTSYSATGAMHILSVSGMHVGVVYMVLLFLLSFLDGTQRKKVFKTLFILCFLWAYAFLTGLSPAVIRATLMFTFVALAFCFERKSQLYNTIFMSAFLMLLYNPNFLFDVGFQLSYAAVLSIIFFQPIFNQIYSPKSKFYRFCWTMFSVSMAAQLGTTPFTLYYFQQFPNYFLLTNFVAIDLSSLIIYLAMTLLMISTVPFISVAVAFLLKWSLLLLNFLIVRIQHLPFSVLHISLDLRQTGLLFLSVCCLSAYYFTRKYTPLFIGLLAFLLVCLVDLQIKYNTLTSSKIIVYAGRKGTHVNLISRRKNCAFTTDSTEMEKISNSFWQRQQLEKPLFLDPTETFFSFKGLRFMVLTNDMLKNKTTNYPLELDYLIIGNHTKPKIDQLLSCVQPHLIIVDKTISKWYAENIKQGCLTRGVAFYSVAENGAYRFDIAEN
jgi:competence protein ComEC